MDPIQPKENVGLKQENARFVTVDEFHVLMKKAENKGQQDKKDIYELMRAMRDKLMDVGNKIDRIDSMQVKSNDRIDFLEEKVSDIDQTCLAIRSQILESMQPKPMEKEKNDSYADRKSESRNNESKSHRSSHRDKSFEAPEREKKKERERDQPKRDHHKRDRKRRRKISRESHKSHERKSDKRRKHDSDSDSSISLDTSRSRKKQTEPGRDNDSRREPRVITGQGGLLPLTEIQLQKLAKPDNCVKFIGKLLLASYPEDFFLKQENSFAAAVTSHHIDALYSIVSKRYQHIIRRGHPSRNLTKEEMTEVMRNRVRGHRGTYRHLMY